MNILDDAFNEALEVYTLVRNSREIKENILVVVEKCVHSLKNGGKIMFCGNGGSAADAQHLAAELSGRFMINREPLPALALHANTSFLTAVANDFSYNEIFSRMVRGIGREEDVLIGISTSGNSPNVIEALQKAAGMGIFTIGMTGKKQCRMDDICDVNVKIPSAATPRIQEGHILVGHVFCQMIEAELFDA